MRILPQYVIEDALLSVDEDYEDWVSSAADSVLASLDLAGYMIVKKPNRYEGAS